MKTKEALSLLSIEAEADTAREVRTGWILLAVLISFPFLHRRTPIPPLKIAIKRDHGLGASVYSFLPSMEILPHKIHVVVVIAQCLC